MSWRGTTSFAPFATGGASNVDDASFYSAYDDAYTPGLSSNSFDHHLEPSSLTGRDDDSTDPPLAHRSRFSLRELAASVPSPSSSGSQTVGSGT